MTSPKLGSRLAYQTKIDTFVASCQSTED